MPGIEPDPAPPVIGAEFDPSTAGSISGRVRWLGAAPHVPPIQAATLLPGGGLRRATFPNPNAPQVEPLTKSLRGAVVFLEGVAPARSRPWDHEPLRMEIEDGRIALFQGGREVRRCGFVPAGAEVNIVSRDSQLHVLSGRGTEFFALAFPDPGRPLRRRMNRPGLVELSNTAFKYWQRAYCWVAEHSYFTWTDAAGRFDLPQVPPGEYRVVAWHPNPRIAASDRDPNTGMVMRLHFAEPLRAGRAVRLQPRESLTVELAIGQ